MSAQLDYGYQFGDFVLFADDNELRYHGEAVDLPPKVFDTLRLLVENHGRLVTKQEFLDRLWPGTFVEETVLAHNISYLRKTLRSGQAQDGYIETVPKRGYRFNGQVHTVARRVTTPAVGGAPADLTVPLTAVAELAAKPANHPSRRIGDRNGENLRAGSLRRRASDRLGFRIARIAAVGLLVAGAALLLQSRHRAALSPIRSIGVLPMENLSGDPSREYFSDGLTDEVITALAKLQDLRVVSRTSTMQYKGSHKSLPQIARELNVDALLEGTVVESGGRLRVRAQLVRGETDEHVWAEAYERDRGDVLGLENELAADIASALRARLPSGSIAHGKPVNPGSHELYLKGRYLWNKRDRESLMLAIDYFQQAIGKDPSYAAAYSGLADCYILMGGYGYLEFPEALAKARSAAEGALRLDEELPEAHTSLGLIKTFDGWSWEDARRHFERAIELDPNYATAHHWYGDGYLAPMGRLDEAIGELRKANAIDPLSPIIATDVGKELLMARRYDEAVAQLRHVLELDPQFGAAHGWLSQVYVEKKMFKEALAELELAGSHEKGQDAGRICGRGYVLARAGERDQARDAIREVLRAFASEVPRQSSNPGCIAIIYAALGQKDEAFAWLEKAYEAHTSYMTGLKNWPPYDPLRSDARFADLERRVGLR